MAAIPINIADLVGGTPMVQFTRLLGDNANGVQLFGKIEALNPGGSVKDRIGVAMIEAAERDGLIEPGRSTIVEATSGNTGIALAFVCAARGYDLRIFLPQGMSREREALLRMYGATVEVVESLGGMGEAVAAARALASEPDHFLPDQFSNPANPEAHRTGTGPEILKAMDGKIDIFVAGVGTGGTITGAGEAIKAKNPKAQVIAVEPQSSAVLSGRPAGPHRIQGIGAGFVPAVLNRDVLDEVIAVPDEAAIETARLAASREGVLAGLSCGAALWGAMQVAGAARIQGQAHRLHPAGLGRALHLRAVLRPAGLTERSASTRPVRFLACWASEPSAASPASCGATCAPRTSAIPPRAASHRWRSSRRGPACTRCSPTASRTRCRTRGCRSSRARSRTSAARSPGSRSTRPPTSATGSSSTTGPASSSARPR